MHAIAPNAPSAHKSRHDWLALLAIVALCLPALTLGASRKLSSHTMENMAIVTSQETWYRMAEGEPLAWLVSTNDGVPRLEKPPMATWLNLFAWIDLDPAAAAPQQLIFRARCVTAALGLMMLASIFLMARMLGDVRFAALATMAVASTIFFERQARTASYDIHYVAWTTLAIALGLWAMRPLGESPSMLRRCIGWGGCALSLCAAVMSKNPLPYLLALPTLAAAIVLLSPRRKIDALCLIVAVLASAVPVGAWYWHVFAAYPRLAERALSREVQQPRTDYQVVYYYLALFGLVVPWTLWLLGSIVEPFRMPRGERRRSAMFALFMFAFIIVSMSIPAAKQQRYILGILPAVGLLVAAFIRRHDDRVRAGETDQVFRMIAASTWVALGAASFLAPWFLAAQDQYIQIAKQWLDDPHAVATSLAWPWAIMLALLLISICVLGWRWHAAQPWRSSMAMGVWMILLMTAFWPCEATSPDPRLQAYVDGTARVRAIVGNAPLRSLRMTKPDVGWQFNEEFRIYYGRLIHRVWPDELDAWLRTVNGDAYVLARPEPERIELLQRHGFERIAQAQVDKNDLQDLWRRRKPAG